MIVFVHINSSIYRQQYPEGKYPAKRTGFRLQDEVGGDEKAGIPHGFNF